MTYSIKPLLLDKLKVSKGQTAYLVDWEKEVWSAIATWYIEAMGQYVLIDTGISYLDIQKYLYGHPYQEGGIIYEVI